MSSIRVENHIFGTFIAVNETQIRQTPNSKIKLDETHQSFNFVSKYIYTFSRKTPENCSEILSQNRDQSMLGLDHVNVLPSTLYMAAVP